MGICERDGVRLAFRVRGRGDPVLLLAGLGADCGEWEPQVRELERAYCCILVDHRGVGGSSAPPGPYVTRQMARDAAAVLDQLSLGPVHVIGASMGGAIAQELALLDPARVRSLVLSSSWCECDAYLSTVIESYRSLRPQVSPGDFTRLVQLWIYSPAFFSRQSAALAESVQNARRSPMTDSAFAAQCDACLTHNTSDRLAAIRIPVLVTWGEADRFTRLQHSRALVAGIPGAKFRTFPDLAHAHQFEDPALYNETIRTFWSGVGSGGRG